MDGLGPPIGSQEGLTAIPRLPEGHAKDGLGSDVVPTMPENAARRGLCGVLQNVGAPSKKQKIR